MPDKSGNYNLIQEIILFLSETDGQSENWQ